MKLKRVLSLLLAMVMTVSLLTLPVHAEDNDFASLTVAEQYAALKSADNEAEAQALFDTLTEQQQTALVTYAQTQAEQEYTVPQTVVFTEAGPFMPPVNVAPVRMKTMARAAVVPAEDDGNGLVFTKKATDNGNGTYTITMEAYTTGKVITSTKTAPVDIVLVLDQSGSMAFDFDGNSTRINSDRRQYAMKQAVNSFIDNVKAKYDAEKSDHRMAIVTFGSNASTLQGWTVVNEAGKNTLQGKISGLPVEPSGATNVAAGMEQAETLMGSGYSYTGTNTQRQKVVIVFTDGVPTTQTNFNVGVANAAITTAKTMKDAGVTIYSVGIFAGADPNKIHGDYYYRAVIADTPCDGSVNSYWGTTNLSSSNKNDFADPDIPAGNRFLNYISNNYDATNIGLRFNGADGVFGGYQWIITQNFTRTADSYYLTANNSASLSEIFQTISENIQSANINLGSETVIKDEISTYFTAPANASDIHLYTAAAKSDGTFKDRVAAPDTVTATVKDDTDTVSVTGFNFNDNFVSDKVKTDGTYGKKLIIEFTVTPKDGFLGGNNVPTNGEAAVYDKGVTEVEAEESPTVNVPIQDVTVSAQDKYVYLLHTMTEEECKTGATATCNGVNLLDETAYTGENAWKAKFVTITTNITRPADALTDDTTYTISVTVKPNTNGTDAVGTANSMDGKTGSSGAAKINVFKPELAFNDSEVYYGDTVPAEYSNLTSTVWKHGETLDTAVTMAGTAPTLTLTYTPDSTKIADGKINTKQDVPVKATVKIGSEDVTQYTTFLHEGCNSTCGWTEPTTKGDPAFLLHVKTCTLTVQKDGWDDKDANQSFIFNVTGGAINQEIKVTVQENGSAKITGLPVGSYTVSEDGKWSWRYTAVEDGNATLSAANPNATVTIENNRTYTKWLSGDNYAVNHVGGIKMPQGTFAGSN